jgi:hypothetical protein
VKVTGAAAWWLWGAVHVFFLVGVRNRLSVMLGWMPRSPNVCALPSCARPPASLESQPAAAQSYSGEYACPAGTVYDPTYGCSVGGADDYGYYGYPTVLYGQHHGFAHMGVGADGTIAHHGMGFRSIGVAHVGSDGFADRGVNVAHLGRGGFAHSMGVAHVRGFGHMGGGFGGFHGGGGFGGGGHR